MPTLSTSRRAATLVALALVLSSLLGFGSANAAVPAPTGLTPSSVSVSGIPTLSWDEVVGAKTYTVEVYRVSDMAKVWSTTTTQHQVVPARQLPGGAVMWRVRAVNGADASDWVEATLDHDTLAGPSLVGPSPGAVLQQPDEPVVLTWTAVDGATSYTVEVSTDSTFTDSALTRTETVTSTTMVVQNALVAQPYFWRVRAALASDLLTEWSSVGDYEVAGLSKPVLTAPADGPFTNLEDVVLDWEPVPGARAYNLQVSVDQNFPAGNLNVDQKNITGTRYSPPVTLNNDQYYWRVQPIDNSGNTLDWGSVDTWTFRRHWPDQPTLQFPADGATISDPVTFEWSPVHLASSYRLDISGSASFTGAGTDICTTVHTTYVPSGKGDCFPEAAGTYYWRVVAFDGPNPEGVQTDEISSQVGTFTYLPDPVSLLSPAPGATDVQVPTLRWTAVPGAARYKVTITPTDGGVSVGSSTTTSTSFTPRTELSPGKTYRWNVQSVSNTGREGTDLLPQFQRTFTVSSAPEPTATTPEPLGPGGSGSRFPTLAWTEVVDATGYKILVRRTGTVAWQTLADKFPYPAGEDDAGLVIEPGTYQWMVQAYQGSILLSSSSTTSTFTITPLSSVTGEHTAMTGTAANDPATSCATSLPGKCQDLRQTPVLAWDADPAVGSYRVWISRDAEMTNVLTGYPRTVEGTRFLPTAALPDGQAGSAYYWSVQACKIGPTSCTPLQHAGHAFNKLSKPIETISPVTDEVRSNEVTFEWRDYLETNQDPTASPGTDPTGVSDVEPTVEAKQYRIQVSSDANFQTLAETAAVVDQTTYTSFLDTYPEGPLYWRVQAIDGSNNNLAWSPAVKFLKRSPTTTLLEPVGGASVSGTTPFRWEPVPYAARYDVEIYRNGDTTGSSTNRVLNDGSLAPAASLVNPLPVSSTAYTWRVRPVDVKGRPGRWTDLASPSARFFVEGTAPSLLDPAPDAVVESNAALFTWTTVPGAASYRFERRKVGSTSAAETVKTPALGFAPTTALASGTWEWRVTSLDAKSVALASSGWRRFTVNGSATADTVAPTVVSKAPGGSPKLSENFRVRFSEQVTGVSGKTMKLFLKGRARPLAAVVKLDSTKTRVVLNPSANLKRRKTYVLKLTSGIKDNAGNALAPYSWSVTTR